ncbi:MAG: hypothetical protein Q8K32_31330 [Archangium sp.]|nr:hypothetical protein [Archangium sp.]
MPALAINGVSLPVAIDDLELAFEPVGTERRNQRGHRVLERRRSKWMFNFELSNLALDEAMMFRSLILGDGEFWNTLTSAFGAKGLPLTGTGAWTGAGGGNPLNVNGVFRLTAGQTMIIPGKFYDQSAVSSAPAALTGATVVGWRRDDAAGTFRIFGHSWRALEVGGPFWSREKLGSLGASGAVQDYSGTESYSITGGALTVIAPGAGGPWSYSNLTVIPWFLPRAQLDQLLEGQALTTYTLPQLPRVYVTSDLLPTEQLRPSPAGLFQSSIICHGKVESLRVTPAVINGAWNPMASVLTGSLIEV